MAGGFELTTKGSYFEKNFKLAEHNLVTIRFNAIALDSWDNEKFLVYADGKEIVK